MANQLKMAKVQAIIGLLEQGWAHRRISRELGVHRETVARYDRLRQSNRQPTPGQLDLLPSRRVLRFQLKVGLLKFLSKRSDARTKSPR